jgi:hypothetical protein
MKWVHRLTEIDTVNRTAICSNCGPVGITPNQGKFWKCKVLAAKNSRVGKYKRKYGLDVRTNEVPKQCELCGGATRIAYDHDHATGKHRGWLCMKCNTALGLVNDDVELLKKMIAYLTK